MRRHAGDLRAEGSSGLPALQTFLFPFFLRDLFLSLGAQKEVLSQVKPLCGKKKKKEKELGLPEPSEIGAPPPESSDVPWAGVPDLLLLVPSPPARTARIQTVRLCRWMCPSVRRPMWSFEGERPGKDKGDGRQSPKVRGALGGLPQQVRGSSLRWELGPLQELLSSLPGGGGRRRQQGEHLRQLGPQSGAHL